MDDDYNNYDNPLNLTNEEIVEGLNSNINSHYDLIMCIPQFKEIYERKQKERKEYVNSWTKTTIGSITYHILCFIKFVLIGN